MFEKLEKEAFAAGITPKTKESMDWFRRKAHNIRRVNRLDIVHDDRLSLRNRQAIGKMYFYFYDPKHKKTLPYYDAFPLTIIVGPAKDGFYGINLHYLPPLIRAKFLDELMKVSSNHRLDEDKKFRITYSMLKGAERYKEFKPCFKHYLTKHVRGRFALVPANEWEIATFLPAADFQKAGKRQVYRDSRRMI